MVNSSAARDSGVQSVDRAVSILQVLARSGSAGVTEIAAELDVHKSTVSRLLSTLGARGLVEQTTNRGRYRLGYGVVQLAAGANTKTDLSLISRPICQALAESVGETVNIAISDGRAIISIDQVIGSAAITTVNWVGQRTPMHATSSGKVHLADMGPDELQTHLDAGLERYTDATIVDPSALKQQLETVREQGYAQVQGEHEVGLAAVSAPIRSLTGKVVAALAVSGPQFRINPATIPGIAAQVTAAASEISERNGYPKAG
jgi:IclR family acetate operon transcriptional repressor